MNKKNSSVIIDKFSLDHYDYLLPDKLIAQTHITPRSFSRLMVLKNNKIYHKRFYNIKNYLKRGDIIIINETKVMKNKFFGKKLTGAKIQLILEEKVDNYKAICRIQGTSSVKVNNKLIIDVGKKKVNAIVLEKNETFLVKFSEQIDDIINKGFYPNPPYIKRTVNDEYQTIFARNEIEGNKRKGSVAAPTAGLHFTKNLFRELNKKGIITAKITLHVSFSTFKPIREKDFRKHKMHGEYISISEQEANKINDVIKSNGRIFIVGTTTLKALETVSKKNKVYPYEGYSDLFIYPGYKFNLKSNGLITNFHLPKSSLLLLVSAYYGRDKILEAYKEAVNKRYRFFSLGDAMLLHK